MDVCLTNDCVTLRVYRWETGTSVVPQELQDKVCQEENHLMKDYDSLLAQYMTHSGPSSHCWPVRSVHIGRKHHSLLCCSEYDQIRTVHACMHVVHVNGVDVIRKSCSPFDQEVRQTS